MNSTAHNLSISVIIITYNRSKMLNELLSSLAEQFRLPEEVIVVDNNSTDTTKQVALSFSNKLNIKYVFEAIQGVAVARNTGIKNATGDIIAFIDDDCVADREWLKYLEIPFIKDPSIGMVGGKIRGCRVKGTLVEDYCIADGLLGTVDEV